ncbi:MAG: response regulator [Myxococcales bacterium]|nr:response regulator [Myxococcales bacterium]
MYDITIVRTGDQPLDLRELLGRPAVEMFAPGSRDRLLAAFRAASDGVGSQLRASMTLAGSHYEYVVHICPGERFVHVDLDPLPAAKNAGPGESKESDPGSRLEYIGMVASRISHDFKNLLAAILVNAEFLRRESADAECVQEVAEEILVATERARELIEQILDYAGSKAEPRSLVELNELTREMGRLLEVSTPPTVVLRYDLEASLPPVRGQPLRLRQLLLNFIVNASEAIGEQVGAIMISTRMMDATEEVLSRSRTRSSPPSGSYVCLEVEDTGPGLDAETARRIFDPFFSTKADGHGLGLAACLTTVEEHGGALLLDSAPGQGARFRVLLPPAAPEEPQAAAEVWQGVERDYEGRTVLIIDDDDLVRSVTRRTLRARGFEVLVAVDGLQGIETFDEQHERLDAVLLDMGMPYMTGDDVFEELRRIDPRVPIVFVSGQSEGELYKHGAVTHADGVVFKPFRDQDLLGVLSRLIDRDEAQKKT